MKKLLASPFGTALKTFISTILTLCLAMEPDQLFAMDANSIRALVGAGILSALPVIINWLNPNYTQYGVNKAPKETSFQYNQNN